MPRIHPTAIVHPDAQIEPDVAIGPYCTIGEHVRLGAGTILRSHVVVDGHTTIGRECQLFPFACIGMQTQDLKYAGGPTYAEIASRTVLREFSTVNTGTEDGEVTRIGSKCLIMAYCHVAHGCVLGNEVVMSNSTQLAGEVKVEDCAIIGGIVGIHPFCRVGTLAMVGACAKVSQDCPPYMIIDGDPVAVVGPNIVGLQRHGISQETRSALKEAYRLTYREGMNRAQALERIRYEVADSPEIRRFIAFYTQSTRGVH